MVHVSQEVEEGGVVGNSGRGNSLCKDLEGNMDI